MPMTNDFIEQLNAELPDVAFLWFVRVTVGLTVFRFCSDRVPQTSRGDVYLPFPNMSAALPAEQEGQAPQLTLIIDDVEQTIEAELRGLPVTETATVDVELIASDDINTPQIAVAGLKITDVSGDGISVELELQQHRLLAMRCPGYSFVPSVTPGLFGA